MKNTKRIKVYRPLIIVILLAALIVSSCRSKATHLTQELENPGDLVQNTSQTIGDATENPEQETPREQSPSQVYDPTATSIEPFTTQGVSTTLPLVQTPTSPPIVLTPTATSRSSTPQSATSTLAPTQTRTTTPTKTTTMTLTPTKTATLTLTPTLQTGWEGEWVFFVGQGDGPYKNANGIITLDGLLAEGSFTLDGVEFSFIADLSANQQNLNGRYQWGATEGWLAWLMDLNRQQFIGTLDNVTAFCAARPGMPRPDPCGHYVPY